MNKTILSVIIAAAAIAGIWYLVSNTSDNNQANNDTTTVAKVNGVEITRADLTLVENRMAESQGTTTASLSPDVRKALEKEALDSLIAQKLVQQAIVKEGLTASSTQVDAQMEQIKGQFESQTAYAAALTQENLTEEKLREQITEELSAENYFNTKLNLKNIAATETEIQAYYNESIKGSTNVPPYNDVKDQVKTMLIQEKQREMIVNHIQELRDAAEVEVLI